LPHHNIKYPLINGDKGMFATNNTIEESVKQNIKHVLMTDIGERVMNPSYGCGLKRRLYDPLTDRFKSDAEAMVDNAIRQWVTNCNLISVVANIKEDLNIGDPLYDLVDYHSVILSITYSVSVSNSISQQPTTLRLLITA
jgi:phage baseplate assembly protein W